MVQAKVTPRLPAPATRLLGREREVAEACALLSEPHHRLLTLTGPPGTGKTRLALEIARRLAPVTTDGACFVDLSSVSDPSLVLHAIAEAISVREAGRRHLFETVSAFLSEREVVLVLDNFEQVLEAAPVVARLLAACPGLRVLATSRAPLRLTWEQEMPVPPLDLPDPQRLGSREALVAIPSVELFVDRARALRPEFDLTSENAPAIAEICVRLDGLPLAIELAASRIRSLSPDALLDRLANRLDLLADGPRDLPARQRALRAAIGWSYGLLSADEKALFRRLSVFVGGFDAVAARGVVESAGRLGASFDDGISVLVDSSLVQAETASGGGVRYRMLETMREYGIECVIAAREFDSLTRGHARYFAEVAAAGEDCVTGAEQVAWIGRLDADHANVQAALGCLVGAEEWEPAAAMPGALWRFWWRRGHLTLGRRMVREVLELAPLPAGSVARAKALVSGGLLALWQGDYAASESLLQEAASIAGQQHAGRVLAYALAFLCRTARDQGGPGAAELGGEAVTLFRSTDDGWGLATALHFRGLALLHDQPFAAEACFEESAGLFRAMASNWDLAMPMRGLGLVAYVRGDQSRARDLFEESAALFRSGGDDWSLAMLSHDLGYVALSQGRVGEAAALLGESLRTWRALGNMRGTLTALAGLGGVAASVHPDAAARLLGSVDAIATGAGVVLAPTDRATLDHVRRELRTRLTPAAFEASLVEGRTMGLQEAVEAAIEVEARISESLARKAPAEGASLTPRELEVAGLLPLGMTNRQIAERLVISEGTAGIHVKHILGKLGFTSRAQVAGWVVERGLANALPPD